MLSVENAVLPSFSLTDPQQYDLFGSKRITDCDFSDGAEKAGDGICSQSTVASLSLSSIALKKTTRYCKQSTLASVSTDDNDLDSDDEKDDDDEWEVEEDITDATSQEESQGEISREEIASPPSFAEEAKLVSEGSSLHGMGLCKPCAWFWKPQGCIHGPKCFHCHLCPANEVKTRKKSKAIMLKATNRTQSGDASLSMVKPASPLVGFPDAALIPSLSLLVNSPSISAPPGLSMPAPPGLEPPVALSAVKNVPSEGSGLHGTGSCTPCAWFWKPQGCERGEDCRYCHLCPRGEVKARKKAKSKALRSGNAPALMESVIGEPVNTEALVSDEYMVQKDCKSPPQNLVPSMQTIPTSEARPLALPSTGSALHHLGTCRPCAWFWKPQGCSNGNACCHCHLCPKNAIKERKQSKVASLRADHLESKAVDEDKAMVCLVNLSSML